MSRPHGHQPEGNRFQKAEDNQKERGVEALTGTRVQNFYRWSESVRKCVKRGWTGPGMYVPLPDLANPLRRIMS